MFIAETSLIHTLTQRSRERFMTDTVNTFMQALIALDRVAAKQIMEDLCSKVGPIKFVEEVVVAALERIGAEWQNGRLALSQVYMGGRICENLVDEIMPPGAPQRKDQPKMAVCVLADHHKLGKIIVYSLLRAGGFELADYGTVDVDALVKRVKKDGVKILLISVLMLPSALKIRKVREKFEEMRLDVKIIVGGAPFRFDDHLWREVGADAMGRTASEALTIVQNIMGGDL